MLQNSRENCYVPVGAFLKICIAVPRKNVRITILSSSGWYFMHFLGQILIQCGWDVSPQRGNMFVIFTIVLLILRYVIYIIIIFRYSMEILLLIWKRVIFCVCDRAGSLTYECFSSFCQIKRTGCRKIYRFFDCFHSLLPP